MAAVSTRAGATTARDAFGWILSQYRNLFALTRMDGMSSVQVMPPMKNGSRQVIIPSDLPNCNPLIVYLFALLGDITCGPSPAMDIMSMDLVPLNGLTFDDAAPLSGDEYIKRIQSQLVNPPEANATGYSIIPINLRGKASATVRVFVSYAPAKAGSTTPATPVIKFVSTIDVEKMRTAFATLTAKDPTTLKEGEKKALEMMWSVFALMNTSFFTLARHTHVLDEVMARGALRKKSPFGFSVIFRCGDIETTINDWDPRNADRVTSIIILETIQVNGDSKFDPQKPNRTIEMSREQTIEGCTAVNLTIPGLAKIVEGHNTFQSIGSLMKNTPAPAGYSGSETGVAYWQQHMAELAVAKSPEQCVLQFRGVVHFGLPYIAVNPAPAKETIAHFKMDNFTVSAITNITDEEFVDATDVYRTTAVIDADAQSARLAAEAKELDDAMALF